MYSSHTFKSLLMANLIVNILILIAVLSVSTGRELVGNAVSLRPARTQGFEPARPQFSDYPAGGSGTKWAVLVAGSNGFTNYRHQADVCHAYQVLKKGGLKDENIIVFMYDDIAFDPQNPRPGVIINQPHGSDVYEGVLKDYTGNDVNAENFFNVILGNKNGITGKGSGKVVESGPDDTIFIYYTDHGAAGILGMPYGGFLYADDFIKVLTKKYESRSYAKMVIYIEACESGSIFEGLLSPDMNIYATTAANSTQSSYASYCDGDYPYEAHPPYGDICLGDMYSVSWIEDSEKHDQRTETLDQQFKLVKRRVQYDNDGMSSQVQQFGDMGMASDSLSTYIGTNPDNNHPVSASRRLASLPSRSSMTVSQRDADIFHLNRMIQKSPRGSEKRTEAKIKLANKMKHRVHVDQTMKQISKLLFGSETGEGMLHAARPTGQPLVDDWDCLKNLVSSYEYKCGALSVYGRKYTRAMSNICNAGIKVEQFGIACDQACSHKEQAQHQP